MHIYCNIYLQLVTIKLFTKVNNHNLRTVWHWAVMTDVSWSLNLKGQLFFPLTAICVAKTEKEGEKNNLCMTLFQHLNIFAISEEILLLCAWFGNSENAGEMRWTLAMHY